MPITLASYKSPAAGASDGASVQQDDVTAWLPPAVLSKAVLVAYHLSKAEPATPVAQQGR